MSPWDYLRLAAYRSIPDSVDLITPVKGRMIVNGYLSGKKGRKGPLSRLQKQILSTPGSNQSLYQYLTGPGRDKIPEIVGHHLGDHWYTGPAKLLSRLPIARDMVVEKVLENTLPKVNGSTELARQFLAAGGNL